MLTNPSGIPRLAGSRTRVSSAVVVVVGGHGWPRTPSIPEAGDWAPRRVIDDGASPLTAQNSAPSLLISTLGGGGRREGWGGGLLVG